MTDRVAAGSSLDPGSLSTEELQRLFAAVVKAYAGLREEDPDLPPFPEGVDVNASEGTMAVSAILEAVGVELFEVALWRSWGRG